MAKPATGCAVSHCLYGLYVVKVHQNGSVINKAVFLALGINTEGQKELLGMWLAENEGTKFWLSVLTELKTRGLQDILIACVDGLKGFPDTINSVFPQIHIQLCIIHMVRNSLKYVSWKDYKAATSGLKTVYQAPTEDAALMAMGAFPPGTPIYAVADGVLVRNPYPFYSGTSAVEIRRGELILRYGEIANGSHIGGSSVKKGQIIAKVGRLNSGSSMLHLEIYTNGASSASLTTRVGELRRRSDVTDPAPYLNVWKNNLPKV